MSTLWAVHAKSFGTTIRTCLLVFVGMSLFLVAHVARAGHTSTSASSSSWEFCQARYYDRVIRLWHGYPTNPRNGQRNSTDVMLVKSVQKALRAYDERTNYLSTNVSVDGYYGYGTERAVIELQRIELKTGGPDGKVGSGTRSVLCNLDSYLANCRRISDYTRPSTMRMNGCRKIELQADGGFIPEPCEVKLTWLSGSGGTKTVPVAKDTRLVRVATGVRNGALFRLSHNCDIATAFAEFVVIQ